MLGKQYLFTKGVTCRLIKGINQLPDIAGPFIGKERFKKVIGIFFQRKVVSFADSGQVIFNQFRKSRNLKMNKLI